jgi:hypothetical protein
VPGIGDGLLQKLQRQMRKIKTTAVCKLSITLVEIEPGARPERNCRDEATRVMLRKMSLLALLAVGANCALTTTRL